MEHSFHKTKEIRYILRCLHGQHNASHVTQVLQTERIQRVIIAQALSKTAQVIIGIFEFHQDAGSVYEAWKSQRNDLEWKEKS